MKNYLKFGLTALVSGGVCSTLTYILTKRYYEAKCQEEIAETRELYRQKKKELEENGVLKTIKPAEKDEKHQKKEETDVKPTKSERKEYQDYANKYKYSDGKPDLDELVSKLRPAHIENADDPEAAAEEMLREAGMERVPERNWRDLCENPFPIDYDTFAGDENYEKCELWYYADGILAEEDPIQGYTQVTNVEEVIGYSNLACLKGDDPDDETYVRNERFGTDYIIYRETDTFQEALYGVDSSDDQPSVEKIRKKRRVNDEDEEE